MKLLLGATLLCLVTWTAPRLPAADEILIADFEGPDYAAWKSTGQAFGSAPARGTLPGQMHVDGFRGQGLVNSYFQGDGTTGTLTSPEFVIERKYIAFLIGGGKDPEKLALRLLVDGQSVRSATRPSPPSGRANPLRHGLPPGRNRVPRRQGPRGYPFGVRPMACARRGPPRRPS